MFVGSWGGEGGRTAITSIAFGAVEGNGGPYAGVRHFDTRMPSERTRGVVVRICWSCSCCSAWWVWRTEKIRWCEDGRRRVGVRCYIVYACVLRDNRGILSSRREEIVSSISLEDSGGGNVICDNCAYSSSSNIYLAYFVVVEARV